MAETYFRRSVHILAGSRNFQGVFAMQHTVEDISPVKKKVVVTVSANEVDAIINSTTAKYRSRVALPGFRKGKAPLPMVEKRFSQDIYEEAANELLNGNVSQILEEMAVEPVGELSFEDDISPIKRGEEFAYSFSFEVMPEMLLPEYNDIGVEEDDVVVEDREIDDVLERVRKSMAERTPVEEKRLAEDGDVLSMDFEGFDENNEPVEGVAGKNFQVAIGDGQVIPDFEALAKTILPGEEGEGKVAFPEDYTHAPLAGKTVTMKIKALSLDSRILPEINDEFAKKAGGFDTVVSMRDNIRETYVRNRKEMARAKAQSLLLEKLLEKMDFPLPEGMVERYIQNIIHGKLEEMSRKGKEIAELIESDFESMKEEAKEEAEKFAKTQLFLLTVAKKEKIEATPQEMNAALRQIAARNGRDIKEVQEQYMRNNLYPALRDRIVADKAMDVMYNKAKGIQPDGEEKSTAVGDGVTLGATE